MFGCNIYLVLIGRRAATLNCMPLCSPMVHQKGCIQTQQVSRLNRCSIEGTCGGLCVQCVQSAGQTHFGMAKNNNRQSHIRKAFLWRFTWGCLPSICTISHDKHASGQPALLYLTSLVPYHTIHTLLASLLFCTLPIFVPYLSCTISHDTHASGQPAL